MNASAIEFTCDLPLRNFHFDFHGVLFVDEYFKGGEKYRGLFYFFFLPLFIFSIFWSKICDNNVNASNINGNVITYNYVDWMDIDRCAFQKS